MKSKGHLYIYTRQIIGKGQIIIYIYINKYLVQHTEEELHIPRTIIVFRLGKVGEVIGRCKFMSSIVCAIGQCLTLHFINYKVLA
jgi:hypothetical protein